MGLDGEDIELRDESSNCSASGKPNRLPVEDIRGVAGRKRPNARKTAPVMKHASTAVLAGRSERLACGTSQTARVSLPKAKVEL
jgi:hypothetical protein